MVPWVPVGIYFLLHFSGQVWESLATPPINAVAQSQSAAWGRDFRRALLDVGSHSHFQIWMNKTATPLALGILQTVAPQLYESVFPQLQETSAMKVSAARARPIGSLSSMSTAPSFLQLRGSATAKVGLTTHAMNADSARQMLNKIAEESQMKLDMEAMKCADAHDKQEAMTEGVRRDSGDYNAQAAQARARMLGTQMGIAEFEDKLPKLNEALKLHRSKCEDDTRTLKVQIEFVVKDLRTLQGIANLTECGINLGTALLQCPQPIKVGRHAANFVTFGHHVLRAKVSHLRSKTAMIALQKALNEVVAATPHVAKLVKRRQLIHQSHKQRYSQPPTNRAREGTLGLSLANATRRLAFTRRHEHPSLVSRGRRGHMALLREAANSGHVAGDPSGQRRQCIIRSSPTCDTLRDKFLVMQTSVADKADAMQDSLANIESSCKEIEGNYKAQIEEMQNRLQDQQAALAEATKSTIEADEQTRLIGQTLARLQQETQRAAEQCNGNLHALTQQICSVKQIRGELYKMETQRPFIQDCEVSAWVPEECSLSCGGGTQRLVRSVVVPASLGTKCPPLVMQRRCNEHQCPVDCSLDEWGGWSSCSAQCGGGIKERMRVVLRQPSGGGKPCEAVSQSASCGSNACDQDCSLSSWTPWSLCSKACNSGFQERERRVLKEATGQGSCASHDSPVRRQYRRCNEQHCIPAHGEGLRCKSKLDVVVILDGSGSIGEDGWQATKKAGQALVRAFESEELQVAVLLYSGPASWSAYQRCTQNVESVDLLQDCGLIWVSHFTTGVAQLASNIESLAWPKASTLTSAALATAEAELRMGRADAQSIVIAITDGKAMNPRKTTQAASRLRAKARLMWVPVTRHASLANIKHWASKPIADNVLVVQEFENLSKPANINQIVAAACPQVE
mmetsp:Transcript_29931/g.78904  ORF Transcript_29931/g.78904 Transcript_29931/m.78904 type:complete len:910 (-) Transcript_29931:96-2825(-)